MADRRDAAKLRIGQPTDSENIGMHREVRINGQTKTRKRLREAYRRIVDIDGRGEGFIRVKG